MIFNFEYRVTPDVFLIPPKEGKKIKFTNLKFMNVKFYVFLSIIPILETLHLEPVANSNRFKKSSQKSGVTPPVQNYPILRYCTSVHEVYQHNVFSAGSGFHSFKKVGAVC